MVSLGMKKTFIYALKDPVTGLIRYIGKSDAPKKRLCRHLNGAKTGEKCHRSDWLRYLQSKNQKPLIEIVDEVPESEWQSWEVAYIQFFKDSGCDLTNATPGGEAGPVMLGEKNHNFGKKMTPEKRAVMIRYGKDNSNFGRTGAKHPMFGKTGALHPMFGHEHTPEAKEKIKAARATQVLTAERNAKISLTGLGKKRSNNKSGFVGVAWHKAASKWAAEIKIFSKKTYLGLFSNLEDAVFVRALAEDRIRNSLV